MSNAKFKTDTELRAFNNTNDIELIEVAVYGDDIVAIQHVVYNPLLTEAHCRHLYPQLEKMTPWPIITLLEHPSFPTDLLMELALSPRNSARDYIQSFIREHPNPNATDEILVAMALMDTPMAGDC